MILFNLFSFVQNHYQNSLTTCICSKVTMELGGPQVFPKIRRKASAKESSKQITLFYNGLQGKCFHVDFAKFYRTPF